MGGQAWSGVLNQLQANHQDYWPFMVTTKTHYDGLSGLNGLTYDDGTSEVSLIGTNFDQDDIYDAVYGSGAIDWNSLAYKLESSGRANGLMTGGMGSETDAIVENVFDSAATFFEGLSTLNNATYDDDGDGTTPEVKHVS